MRPIKLEFSGLNSYIEKTTIDFEKLMRNGVFGIFGDTGSGKSTILDAISIALYGKIPKENNSYININCDKAIVSYEFQINKNNNIKKYKINRIIIKTEESIKTFKVKLIELKNNNEEKIISEKLDEVQEKIIEILGVTYNDFIKIILIPQGKFSDFIKSNNENKRDMIERIFNLEKYGRNLNDKILRRLESNIKVKNNLEKKLEDYDGISQERYNDDLKEIEILKYNKKRKSIELKLAEKKYKENKEIYINQINLEKFETRQKELKLKEDNIILKKNQLENFNNAHQINPYINIVQSLEKKINEDSYIMKELENKLEILKQELISINKKYEQSYKIKNEKIPQLSTRKIKIQIAREIEKELENIDYELKELRYNKDELIDEKNNLEKIKTNYESKLGILKKSLKEVEEKISKLEIDNELKRKIFKAYEYEKQHNIIMEEYNKKNNKYKFINNQIEEHNLKLKYLNKDEEIINSKLKNINIHYDGLLNKNPGKIEDIFMKNDHLIELSLKQNMLKEKESKKDAFQIQLNKIKENKYKLEKERNTLNDKLEKLKKEIHNEEIEVQKNKYLNLAEELKFELKENIPCPVCGSRHHEYIDYNSNSIINKDKLERLIKDKNEVENKLEYINCNYTEEICLENLILKEIESIKIEIGNNNFYDIHKKLEDEYRLLEIKKNNIKSWESDKEKTEKQIFKLNDSINNLQKEKIRINQTLIFYKEYTKEIKEEIDLIKAKLDNIQNNYISLKSVIKIDNLLNKVNEIKNNEDLLEELNEKYKQLIKENKNLEEVKGNYKNKLHELEIKLIKTTDLYTEKKKLKEEKYKEFISITKGESTISLISNIDKEISSIIYKEEKNKIILEEYRNKYENVLSQKLNLQGMLQVKREDYISKSKQLNQLLKDNKFESIYDVKKSLLDINYINIINDEIINYDNEVHNLSKSCKELKDKLCGIRIEKESLEIQNQNINKIKDELIKIESKIMNKKDMILRIEKNIDKVDNIKENIDKINKQINLLEELKFILEENKFIEYISKKRLIDICIEASDKLAYITMNRYNLSIDDELNFIIIDNYNNKKIRKIDTLSGGEIFLVSLSLSIAFSSEIYLKEDIALEVLFLDEGFGTLDEDTLKRVIEVLKELNSKNLNIGIISHIRELKNIIPNKLLVSSVNENEGSKINIEYN